MAKFRKKPVVVEAFRWDGKSIQALSKWAAAADFASRKQRGELERSVELPIDITVWRSSVRISTRGPWGVPTVAEAGEWIVCDDKGRFWPISHDEFMATYEDVALHGEAR